MGRSSSGRPPFALVLALTVLASCDKPGPAATVPPEPAEVFSPPPVYAPPPPAPTISAFVLKVTVDCRTPPPGIIERYDPALGGYVRFREPLPDILRQAPRLATSVILLRADGTGVKLVDQAARTPEMTYDGSRGVYRISIQYEMESLGDLVGKPLTEADRFVSLKVDYQPALAVHDLEFLGVTEIALRLNGTDVATGAPEGEDGEGRLLLGRAFQSVSGRVEGGPAG